MDLEPILYILASIPVVHRFLSSQAKLAAVQEHLVKQNSEILGRQTAILESLVPILQSLNDRVEALEEEGEETSVIGFRSEEEGEEEEDGEGEDEDQDQEDEPQPMNRRVRGFRRG